MSMYYCKKSRRQFLVGAGKSLLAIPLLPSLLPKEAYAQAAMAPRRLMLFWFDHNNLAELWPRTNAATTAVGSSGAREVRLSALGNATTISRTFSNPIYSSLINRNQITFIRGLETALTYGPVHNNYFLAAGQSREANFPTIDSIIEASRTVYPLNTPSNVRKALRVNLEAGGMFYQRVGSTVQSIPDYNAYSIIEFYNEVFGSLAGGTVPPQDLTNQMKSNILNRVHEAFTSFRANRRISSDDRARLDLHMGYVADLQRNFASLQPPPAVSCTRPAAPANSVRNDFAQCTPLYMDLLAVAFKCGLTKFGAMAWGADDPRWIPNLNLNNINMHAIMHGEHGAELKERAFTNWWSYYTNTIANRYFSQLDVQEGNTGRTYLDNMITSFVCPGGMETATEGSGHSGYDSQQILFGSMGGRLRAGNYISYPQNNGRLMAYNSFMITLFNLMGMQSSEYSQYATNQMGFGSYAEFSATHPYSSRFFQPLTEVLV